MFIPPPPFQFRSPSSRLQLILGIEFPKVLARGKPSTKVSARRACRDSDRMKEPKIRSTNERKCDQEIEGKTTEPHRIHTNGKSQKSKERTKCSTLSFEAIGREGFAVANSNLVLRNPRSDPNAPEQMQIPKNPKPRPKPSCSTRPWRCSSVVPRICGALSASNINSLVSEPATDEAISKSVG